ncbi:X-Pro dipeptidyl-peptidase (S15 family) [Paenibacillus sp. GP183]|jgi:pimeloyl-ACP methyl ester carboxylesterase|nr:X-Pro dipeptidyl-peptidase (S15 family) [Paenibacillus sp. GP183]
MKQVSKRGARIKMIWIVLIVLLLLMAGCLGISGFVGWKLTHPLRLPLDDSPENYGLTYQEIEFTSRTLDVKLAGWLLTSANQDSDSPMTLILSHGYAGTRLEKGLPALSLAKRLVEAGYTVLMFDFRNSGLSSGQMTTVGFSEKQDLLGAIDWVREHQPGKIGLIGYSMGATTSLLAAAEAPDIAGVVADSPFSQLKSYLSQNLSVWSKLPNFPFTWLILTILPRLTGIDPHQVDALIAVQQIYPRPVLFIHSQDDMAIPFTQSEKMWRMHQDRFEFWKTEKAGHVGTYQLYTQEYTSRLLAFFEHLRN